MSIVCMISIYCNERFGSGCGLNTGPISSQISNQTSSLDSPSVLTGFLRRGGSSSSIKMEQKECAEFELHSSNLVNNNTENFSLHGEDKAAALGDGAVAAMMRQQMQITMNLQRKMMIQSQMFEEEKRKLEEQRKHDELKLEIKKLELMLAMQKQSGAGAGNFDVGRQSLGSVKARIGQSSGSVKARVGAKNVFRESINTGAPSNKRKLAEDSSLSAGDGDADRRKRRYTNAVLPPELVLTTLTESGPRPAARRITWAETGEDSYDWKRQKKKSTDEDDKMLVYETLEEED